MQKVKKLKKKEGFLDNDEEIWWKRVNNIKLMDFKGSLQLAFLPSILCLILGVILLFFPISKTFWLILIGFSILLFIAAGIFLIFGLITIIDYKWRYPRKYGIPPEKIDDFQEKYILTNKHWIQRDRKSVFFYKNDSKTLTKEGHYVFLRLIDIKTIRSITSILGSEVGVSFHTTQEVEPIDFREIKKNSKKFETAISFPSKREANELLDLLWKLCPIESEEERSFRFGREHLYYLKEEKGE